jgi:hypothetical protein
MRGRGGRGERKRECRRERERKERERDLSDFNATLSLSALANARPPCSPMGMPSRLTQDINVRTKHCIWQRKRKREREGEK